MTAHARWQEIISENLAASSVPGFKKQDLSFSSIQAGLLKSGGVQDQQPAGPYLVPNVTPYTNFSFGELKPTGVDTHVALEGPGFFEVQMPDGTTALTRDGEFHLNTRKELVTKQGHTVLGEGGPIRLDAGKNGPVSVSPTGEISQGGEVKGTLKVTAYKKPEFLTAIGNGLYVAKDSRATLSTDPKPAIRSGWIEGSNTSTAMEMADLITAMRSFEANQRVVQLHDERTGKLINDLGNGN